MAQDLFQSWRRLTKGSNRRLILCTSLSSPVQWDSCPSWDQDLRPSSWKASFHLFISDHEPLGLLGPTYWLIHLENASSSAWRTACLTPSSLEMTITPVCCLTFPLKSRPPFSLMSLEYSCGIFKNNYSTIHTSSSFRPKLPTFSNSSSESFPSLFESDFLNCCSKSLAW